MGADPDAAAISRAQRRSRRAWAAAAIYVAIAFVIAAVVWQIEGLPHDFWE